MRPVIISIEDDFVGDDTRVTVRLDWADRAFHGHAVGAAAERVRLAAEATLDAVIQIVDNAIDLELMAVATTEVGEASVALAQIRFDRGDILVGSALLGEHDRRLAAVRAVMDAINRRLEPLL
jgi:alpha-D-ribose 1-methylphosphonate 5-triphosphate synthase subunit PhnG